MMKKDSASKRSVESPNITTLSNRLAGGKTSAPEAIQTLPDMLKASAKGSKGGGHKNGVATKSGYDVKTRVGVGGKKKK